MSKQSIGDWLRQNSLRVPVEVVTSDGQKMKGTVLVPKDRSVRDLLNAPEPFIEFDCVELGPTVLSKQSTRPLRQFVLPAANQLSEHTKYLESVGAWRALGLTESATEEQVEAAYRHLGTLYFPDRYPRNQVPGEIADYVESVSRRLYLAYTEIKGILARQSNQTSQAA